MRSFTFCLVLLETRKAWGSHSTLFAAEGSAVSHCAPRPPRTRHLNIREPVCPPPTTPPLPLEEPATLANIRGNTQRVRPVPSHRLLIGIQRPARRIQGRNRVRGQSCQFVGLIFEMQYLLIRDFVLLFMETGAVMTRVKITLIAVQVVVWSLVKYSFWLEILAWLFTIKHS